MTLRALYPIERIIAWRLQTGRAVPPSELIEAIWGNRADGGPLCERDNVRQHIWRLRRKLASHGITIECLTKECDETSLGYLVPAASLTRFRDLLADEIARNVSFGSAAASLKPSPAAAARGADARGHLKRQARPEVAHG